MCRLDLEDRLFAVTEAPVIVDANLLSTEVKT
jgi:hypothetical protein